MKGKSWWLGRLLIHVDFAKETLCWSKMIDNEQTDYLFCISKVKRKVQANRREVVWLKAISIIVGPFKLMFGLSD